MPFGVGEGRVLEGWDNKPLSAREVLHPIQGSMDAKKVMLMLKNNVGWFSHWGCEVESINNKWQGDCFVFDGRVAVNDELQQGEYEQCFGCRRPVSLEDRESEKYEYGIYCPACYASISKDKISRLKERQKQVELAAKRNQLHIGAKMDLRGKRAKEC